MGKFMIGTVLSLQLLFIFLQSVYTLREQEIQKKQFQRNLEVFARHHFKSRWEGHRNKRQSGLELQLKEKSVIYETGIGSDVNHQTCADINMWFVWDNVTKSCHCGDDLGGIVYCNTATKELSVIDCNCLTTHYTSQGTTLSVVGRCLFNCLNYTQFIYHDAPSDCASLNRQGTLCGQCLDGYTVPAYSYTYKCIRCDSENENWGLYIAFAFLPLTFFIVIILIFRINVLSPKLNMFVIAAQTLSIPIFVRVMLSQNYIQVPKYLLLTAYGIWNLDFLRVNVSPDVCINAIPLHILVLDYLIAIYPMLLMAVAYTVVEFYAFGFRPLLYVWKPFHWFFARFRRQWGIQTTIMDAFATFFFFSTTKLLSVSFDLLIGIRIFTSDGKLYSWNLYYDTSIEYFGREHLLYALLTVFILKGFLVFPTSLLLFYQFKICRRCLHKFKMMDRSSDRFVNLHFKNTTKMAAKVQGIVGGLLDFTFFSNPFHILDFLCP